MPAKTKVITGVKTIWLYPALLVPKAFSAGDVPKYSVRLLIPKEDEETVRKINEAIETAYEEGKERLRGSAIAAPPLEDLKSPLRDGDEEYPGNATYEGCFFLNASSKFKPEIVDADMREITDESEIRSGVQGRASIIFYAYRHLERRGIACSLNNLQKISDGDSEPHSERSSAEEDFSDDTDGDDDDFSK